MTASVRFCLKSIIKEIIMSDINVKKKRRWPVVLAVILLIICMLGGFIAVNAARNKKVMNDTVDQALEILSQNAKVTPVDPGEYRQIKVYGLMKFDVSQYDVENIGNLSVMTVNMGFMQMSSFVLSPYEKNMPLLSMDFMYILGNRKAYAEFYDLVADPSSAEYQSVLDSIRQFESKYSDLETVETSPAWYDDYTTIALHKAGKRSDDAKINDMFCDAVRCYMETAETLPLLSDEEKAVKLELTQEYCDGLIEKGGVSTDVFKKELGEETTRDFFNKVFFGTERYRK